jgi:hypothetical protein
MKRANNPVGAANSALSSTFQSCLLPLNSTVMRLDFLAVAVIQCSWLNLGVKLFNLNLYGFKIACNGWWWLPNGPETPLLDRIV